MKSKIFHHIFLAVYFILFILLWFICNYIIFLFQPLFNFDDYIKSLLPDNYTVNIDTLSYDQNMILKEISFKGDSHFSLEAYIKEPINQGKYPAILLLGGMMTGKTAVNYAYQVNNVFLISPDYPYTVRKHYSISNIFKDLHKAYLALHFQIRDNLVLLDFLSNYHKIKQSKIGIMGYSFGVPLALATARIRQNIHNLALIYGGADFKRLLKINFKKYNNVINWLMIQLFWLHLVDFEPEIHAKAIKNIPVLFINGKYDEKIPRVCAEKLHGAFNLEMKNGTTGKEVVWLESKHVHPRKKTLSLEIIEILRQWYEKISFL